SGIKAANLFGCGVACALVRGSVFEYSAQKVQVVLIKLAVDAPRSLVGRNGVFLLPATTGVVIQVDAGVHGFVHGGDVETWRIGKRRLGRAGGGLSVGQSG